MKKFLSVLAIVILLLVGAAVAVPYFFQDKIVSRFVKEINNQLNAKVAFEDISLTMFKSFPNLALSLDDLSIKGVNYFANDTLINAGNIALVMDLMSVIGGDEVKIKSVNISEADINLIVSETGLANWDIVKEGDESTSSSDLKFQLDQYKIKNSNFIYTDREGAINLKLLDLNHEGSGEFTSTVYDLDTETNIESVDVSYGNVSYISNASANLEAILGVDLNKNLYTFKQNKLTLNDLDLVFEGSLALPDEGIDYDIKWSAPGEDFKSFASLIPGVYQNEFKKLKASGTVALNGFVKGLQSETSFPAYDLVLTIKEGSMKYPGFDGKIEEINADCKIMNSGAGPDYTLIDLDKIHAKIDDESFDGKLFIRSPVSDPNIDAVLKGKIDLDKMKQIIPLEKGTDISGIIDADIAMKGKLSDLEKKRYEDFDSRGSLIMKNVKYYASSTEPLDVSECTMTFNPRNVTVNNINATIGNTSLQASGSIDNLIAYALKDDLLKGRFVMNAKRIDLNQMMGDDEDGQSNSVIDIPKNLDLNINTSIDEVIYENIVMKNVDGRIQIVKGEARIPKLEFNTLDGSVVLSGVYSAKDLAKPDFSMDLDLEQLDIKKTYDAFQVVKDIAPIAGKCTGKFSSTLKVQGKLDEHMQPVDNSLNGNGNLMTFGLNVADTRSLKKVADALKMESLSKNVFRDMNLTYEFVNGRMNVDPFTNELDGITALIRGSNGFDQTIDYKMDLNIPATKMGNATRQIVGGLVNDFNKKSGANVSMGDKVLVKVDIFGTVSDPQVKLNFKEQGKTLVDEAKEEVEAKIDEEKAKLEAQAQAEKERLEAEAKKKLEEEKAKIQAELDRKKKEAEAKAKAESDKLKKEAEQKAKDALKDLFGKP